MSPLNVYITLYQYFDAQERVLTDRIEKLQYRILYRNDRKISLDDLQELTYLKIKLDFCRKIDTELLKLFQHM